MKKGNRITIRDVSLMANTSIATASRVLNNTGYPVSPDMKARILKAAKDLGYTPNMLGKALKTGKSHEIGVVVPSLLNPYYSAMPEAILLSSAVLITTQKKSSRMWSSLSV